MAYSWPSNVVVLVDSAEQTSSWGHRIPAVCVTWPALSADRLFNYFGSSPVNGRADMYWLNDRMKLANGNFYTFSTISGQIASSLGVIIIIIIIISIS